MWTFIVPRWVTGPVIAEFWAEDDVGNTSYRTAVLEIEEGTIKCIRWEKKDSECIMLRPSRPTVEDSTFRPLVEIIPHVCQKMEA